MMESTEICRATGIPRSSLNWFIGRVYPRVRPRYRRGRRGAVAVWPLGRHAIAVLARTWKDRRQ